MTKEEKREAQAIKVMNLLGLTYEEAYQTVLDDEAIDRGEKMPWDLTPEQLKESKKARQADRAKPKEKVKRERKENQTKIEIINEILETLNQNEIYHNVEVLNKERQVKFCVGEATFELTLTQKREKKD